MREGGDMSSSSAEPKTREEVLEEKIREVNQRLSVVERLWEAGHTQVSVREKMDRARLSVSESRGEAKYLKHGSKMIESTDEVGALFDMTEALETWLEMGGAEPHSELKRLLNRKVKLLTELGDILHSRD
jgi:hypothetical protein